VLVTHPDDPHEVEVILGRSLGHRREPRVRFRKGRAGAFIALGTRRTRRAAFRAAREARDRYGEKRALVVWRDAILGYCYGVSRKTRGPAQSE
jgi:hypothetical protein